MAQPYLTAVAARRQLKPCKRIHRHAVWIDPAHVTQSNARLAALLEHSADALAETGQIGTAYGSSDRKGDRMRRRRGHQEKDRPAGRKSSQPDR